MEGLGSIPGQGTIFACHSLDLVQPNKYFLKKYCEELICSGDLREELPVKRIFQELKDKQNAAKLGREGADIQGEGGWSGKVQSVQGTEKCYKAGY